MLPHGDFAAIAESLVESAGFAGASPVPVLEMANVLCGDGGGVRTVPSGVFGPTRASFGPLRNSSFVILLNGEAPPIVKRHSLAWALSVYALPDEATQSQCDMLQRALLARFYGSTSYTCRHAARRAEEFSSRRTEKPEAEARR